MMFLTFAEQMQAFGCELSLFNRKIKYNPIQRFTKQIVVVVWNLEACT